MKQLALQMLLSINVNVTKMDAIIKLVVHEIEKVVGKQRRGRPRMQLRYAVAGIIYNTRFNNGWNNVPPIFGNGKTIYGWYRVMVKNNICKSLWADLLKELAIRKKINLRRLIIDGCLLQTTGGGKMAVHNFRNHNKRTLNRMAICDCNGTCVAMRIIRGTAHESRFCLPMFKKLCKRLPIPMRFSFHGDKAYDSAEIRIFLSKAGAIVNIPPRNHGYVAPYRRGRDSFRYRVERMHARTNGFKAAKIITAKTLRSIYATLNIINFVIGAQLLSAKALLALTGR